MEIDTASACSCIYCTLARLLRVPNFTREAIVFAKEDWGGTGFHLRCAVFSSYTATGAKQTNILVLFSLWRYIIKYHQGE